jgi:hypothetical protein
VKELFCVHIRQGLFVRVRGASGSMPANERVVLQHDWCRYKNECAFSVLLERDKS